MRDCPSDSVRPESPHQAYLVTAYDPESGDVYDVDTVQVAKSEVILRRRVLTQLPEEALETACIEIRPFS